MAFAAFGPYQLSRPGQAESLGCRFMGLQLEFAFFSFASHNTTPFTKKYRG
jgi:hypothetical protein